MKQLIVLAAVLPILLLFMSQYCLDQKNSRIMNDFQQEVYTAKEKAKTGQRAMITSTIIPWSVSLRRRCGDVSLMMSISRKFGDDLRSPHVIGDPDLRGAAVSAEPAFDATERIERFDSVFVNRRRSHRVHDQDGDRRCQSEHARHRRLLVRAGD